METKNRTQKVVNLLSSLIAAELKIVASESFYPSLDADASDDTIKRAKDNAAELRRLRTEFENLIFSGGMMK